jgi:hypothetical protein
MPGAAALLLARLGRSHPDDPYATLGLLDYRAEAGAVRSAFRALSLVAHPDRQLPSNADADAARDDVRDGAGLGAASMTCADAFARISAAAECLLEEEPPPATGATRARARIEGSVAAARLELSQLAADQDEAPDWGEEGVRDPSRAGARTAWPEPPELHVRVAEILEELTWKEEFSLRQMREAEAEAEAAPVMVGGGGGADGAPSKRGRRRARRRNGRAPSQTSTWSRPVDAAGKPDRGMVTRHLYVANTGPKFGVEAEALQVRQTDRQTDRQIAVAHGGWAPLHCLSVGRRLSVGWSSDS